MRDCFPGLAHARLVHECTCQPRASQGEIRIRSYRCLESGDGTILGTQIQLNPVGVVIPGISVLRGNQVSITVAQRHQCIHIPV
ncbi:hypothetical protein thalar_00347 [Litoreibacter arenae DSM 19593]|uniref:Uncharacterized protein n=1 Tax=Litoreibacter arenae DSM 19593 TaxID=1123360 RepID=S9S6F0_9RHOB|nr:hypothetical protein thalar_00347 [Litoreibacter arenae DSM 19593]